MPEDKQITNILNQINSLKQQISKDESILFNHKHQGFDFTPKIGTVSKSRSRAYRVTTNQAISNDTWTKVQLNAENYDYLGEFDSKTNYRFTAKKSGYYLVCGQVKISNATDQTSLKVAIYKNGASVADTFLQPSGTGDEPTINVCDIVQLNAAEYVELYAYQYYGGDRTIILGSNNTFLAVHQLS